MDFWINGTGKAHCLLGTALARLRAPSDSSIIVLIFVFIFHFCEPRLRFSLRRGKPGAFPGYGAEPERSSSLYLLRRRESVLGHLAERFFSECVQVAGGQRNVFMTFCADLGFLRSFGD